MTSKLQFKEKLNETLQIKTLNKLCCILLYANKGIIFNVILSFFDYITVTVYRVKLELHQIRTYLCLRLK